MKLSVDNATGQVRLTLPPESGRGVGADRGPAAIIRLAKQRPGEITLVCTGPLTNLAIALNVEPELGNWLKHIVIMGGAYRVPGNTRPHGEFNILLDPEAAEQVFHADLPHVTAIGLDVTHETTLSRKDWEHLDSIHQPDSDLVALITRFTFHTRKRDLFFMHDPLALGVAIDPTIVTCETGTVDVLLSGPERGRTVFRPGEGSTKVAFGVDANRFLKMYGSALGIELR